MVSELSPIINKLIAKDNLTKEESSVLMQQILSGQATDTQIASIITLLRSKGETSLELSSIVKTMWANAPEIPDIDLSNAIDTCGTGGDNSGSINISTASAIVLSACDIKVAKHGNKAVSSQCGAADVLEKLGVKTDLEPLQSSKMLEETNFCFLLAPIYHPGMRFAAKARQELGVRTTFNFLGPLANPFQVPYRMHGLSDPSIVQTYAETLNELGVKRAFVFSGFNGLDELSLSGPNKGIMLNEGTFTELTIDPVEYGFEQSSIEEIKGGDSTQNADIISKIFSNELPGPFTDIVVLNAAVALDVVSNLGVEKAIDKVRQAISSGAVKEKLAQISAFSNTK